MKKILPLFLCLMLLSISSNSSAQNWLVGAGGPTNDEALDIAINKTTGDYFVTGYFTGNATFGTTVLNSSGNSDIFIAKYTANGTVVWAKKAGGTMADRANSIKCDNAGNIFITGYYYGSATFDNTNITSVNHSQDIFIAKYSPIGNLLWVKSMGGTDAETGYSVTTDNAGNAIVTGQFRGTATFGITTLSSAINPILNLPSFDIFIAKFDANGGFLWAKKGSAKYDDRGLDVATDAANNIFLVGQFSDTITFDITHNNSIFNAGFLLKLDANGNEQWLVRMAAQQTIVYSLAVDHNNNILITGDYKGSLAILTTPTVISNSSFTNKVFVAKFSNAGQVMWVENDGSDSEVTSKSIALDTAGNAYIVGLFKCRFDEFSQTYGSGVFYSSGYRDVFVSKYSASGTRQWFKQFGSNKDDYCSGIIINNNNNAIIAGSFENIFNVPRSPSFTQLASNFNYNLGYASASINCGIPNYQNFVGQASRGQKDIFVTSPIDNNQAPFDYFMRTSGGCNQSFVPPCINDCDSAITECRLYIAVANVFEIDTNYIGSKYKTVWSTGQTTDTIHITQSGTYWLHTVRNDGCFQDWDTLQATIYRVPNSPMISDNHLVNVNTHPFTKPVKLCFPDTAILWGQPVNPADSIWWTGTSYTTLNYSTIQTDTTGYYTLHVRNAANCDSATTVVVEIDDFANNTLLDPHIVLADAQANASDSVRICELGTIPIYVMDSNVYVANGSTLMYDDIFWSITGANLQYDSTHNLHNNLISTIPSSGYYTISCHLKDYCAAQVDYYFSRTIYITVLPNPNPIILYPAITCPNDTIWLYTSTYATTYQWSGPSIVSVHNDSIQVLAPATDPVQYSLNVTLVDSLTNTSCSGSAYVELFPRPYPNVSLSPSDGVICPFDSVMLTCDAGINYDWISPAGLSIGSTQSINVNVPGFYHCIQTQTDGCVITSNSVEVKQYNTPFLIVEPSNTICVNESATIFVQANGNANVQWQAPLSGNALQQTITQPGTYVCHITQCGITTIDSVTISQPNTPAFIFSYSTVICPGDSLTLFGNGGMEEYNWLGQNSSDVSLVITQPGTYTLQTTDQYGCIATSAPYTINSLPQPNAPIVSDTNICGGQSITLIASASANISWFNSINTTVPFFIGDTLVTNTINNNTTYYLQTMDAVCGSSIVPVNITVSPAWITPGITGNTNLCVGDTLYLSANQSGLNYSWTQPNTQMDTLSYLQIPNVSTANAGIYTLQYNSGNCFSVVDSFTVNVNTIPIPTISQGFNFTICNGSSFVLQVDSSYTHYLWLPTNDTTQAITITNAGTYSVQVSNNGCIGTSNAVNVSFYPAVATPLVTNDTVCAGNNATLTVSGSGTFSWYDTSNVQIATGATFITPILSASQSYFVQSTDANGCTSAFVQADAILATPLPAPTITSNNTLCEGIDLQFSTALVAGATYNWSGPSGFTSSLQNPTITNVQQNNAGVYQLIVNNFGCNSAIGYDTIVINESPTMPAIVGNLVYCQEDTLLLYVSNPSSLYSYNWLNQNGTIGSNTSTLFYPFISPIDAGNFILTVTQNNCSVTDSVAVIVKPKPTATINSNYNVCVGSTLNLNTNLLNQGTYSWTGPSGFTSNNSINAITNVSQANAGVYQLVVSQDNCNSDPASVTVVVYNYPIISLGNDTSFCSGQSITYTLPSNYLYLWMNGSNANAITVSDSGLVYVAAAYGPGCITRDTVLVDDYHCLGYLPNFITPNGDGNNDYLYFDVEGAKAIDCSVFDRWGREVYRWTDLEGKWNGKSKNGTDVTAGVYYYVVYIKFVDNSESTSKGFVEVIK